MTDKRNSFNAGATVGDGNNITTANSDDAGESALAVVNPSTSGTIVYDNGRVPTGMSWAALLTNATSNVPVMLGYTDTLGTSFRAVAYLHLGGAYGSAGQIGIHTRSSADAQAYKAYVNATGLLEISTNAATVATGTVNLSNSGFIRIEIEATGLTTASTVINARAYSEHSTSPLDSISSGTITTTLNVAAVRAGRFAGTGPAISITGFNAEIGGSTTPYGPAVTNVTKTGSDTITMSEVAARGDLLTATDALTLTEQTTNIGIAAFDSWLLSEEVTETSADTGTEDITLTDVVTSLTVAADLDDLFTMGDQTTQSTPTGNSAFAWGGALTNGYFVATEADTFDLGVGSKGLLFDASGEWIDPQIYTITSISPPTSGFVNVFVSPDFTFTPSLSDVYKEVTPAGAFLDMDTDLDDAITFTDTSVLAVGLDRTDTQTLSEASSLTQQFDKTATDTQTLTDVSALVQGYAGTDSATQTEATADLAVGLSVTDTQTLTDVSLHTAATVASETHTMSDVSSVTPDVAGTDTQTINEQAVGLTVSGAATDTQTLTEVSALTTLDDKAASDTQTLSEAAVGLTVAVTATDAHTITEGTTTHTAATAATDQQLLSGEAASLSGGSNPVASDTWTMDDLSDVSVAADATDTSTLTDVSALASSSDTADSMAMTESPAQLTQSYALLDLFTVTESSDLHADTALTGTDIQTLLEQASLAERQFRDVTDQQILSGETSALAVNISTGDSFVQTEEAVGSVATLEGTDAFTFNEVANAAQFLALVSQDLFTTSEFAFVIVDDVGDDTFPRMDVRFPGVIPEGNIRFPSTEE